jgi:hypothetical protein
MKKFISVLVWAFSFITIYTRILVNNSGIAIFLPITITLHVSVAALALIICVWSVIDRQKDHILPFGILFVSGISGLLSLSLFVDSVFASGVTVSIKDIALLIAALLSQSRKSKPKSRGQI